MGRASTAEAVAKLSSASLSLRLAWSPAQSRGGSGGSDEADLEAAESISLAVWALDASKAVEKESDPIPEPRRHGDRWLLRTLVFVGAACATFLALAPRPAFASVVAPIACLAGLEVCGVCGPTCDAVCTH